MVACSQLLGWIGCRMATLLAGVARTNRSRCSSTVTRVAWSGQHFADGCDTTPPVPFRVFTVVPRRRDVRLLMGGLGGDSKIQTLIHAERVAHLLPMRKNVC